MYLDFCDYTLDSEEMLTGSALSRMIPVFALSSNNITSKSSVDRLFFNKIAVYVSCKSFIWR